MKQTIELETYALNSLVLAVCNKFDVPKEELLGRRRNKEYVKARHVLCYLAYTKTKLSLPEIGRLIDRDHTTILHGYQKIRRAKSYDPDFELLIIQTHLLALEYEVIRRERLKKDTKENAKMIKRIQMEKLNGLRAS